MAVASTDLQITVQEPASTSRRLSITVPRDRVRRTRSAVMAQIANNARLPGFRQGKLPPRILEQRFGPTIEQETLDRVIQQAYREAVESQGLRPISQGSIDNVEYEPESDLRFDAEFEVQPEVELARVSGFTATRPVAEINPDEIEAVLDRVRNEQGSWEPLESGRPGVGDQVTVEITQQGDDPEGEPRTYRFVIGEGQAIPDVEQAIQSLAPGEEGVFTARFPDDFPDTTQAGQEQQLHIRLSSAETKRLPELDDEFARSLGEFEDLAALRSRVEQDVRAESERNSEAQVRGQILEQILDANRFAVPPSMVERYLDAMTGHADNEEHRTQHNHSPEELQRLEQMRVVLRPQAEYQLKRMLVVERLADRENLRATQNEIDARVEEIARRNNHEASQVWLQLEKSGQLQALEAEITEDKVFEYLKSQNTVA